MFRKFFSVLTILLFCVAFVSLAQPQIGYMNFQQVMNELPATDSAATELNAFVTQKQKEFQQQSSDVIEAESDYRNNQASMSQEQQTARQQEIAQMNQGLSNLQGQIQTQIQQKQQQLLAPIYERVNEAISVVAERMGLDFVLNERTSNGENIVYFSNDQTENITEQVLQELQNN